MRLGKKLYYNTFVRRYVSGIYHIIIYREISNQGVDLVGLLQRLLNAFAIDTLSAIYLFFTINIKCMKQPFVGEGMLKISLY